MKKHVLFVFMICCYLGVIGQNKSNFDLDIPVNDVSKSHSSQDDPVRSLTFEYEMLANEKTGFSLLSDGYFTIGTTNGVPTESLDDNCQITFGHPYAFTSYPFFSLDSVVHHPELYFYDSPKQLANQGDTMLSLQATDLEKIDFSFNMIQQDEGEIIRLNLSIENIDNISHSIGMGLLFDPALGLWGDGFVFIGGQLIQHDTILMTNIPGTFEIWERSEIPKGMGVQFEYVENLPSNLLIGNWSDLHYNTAQTIGAIYDLGVEMSWPEITVDPGEAASFIIDIKLESPEFPNGVFIRSDIPQFLSVENNLLFPRNIKSLVKLDNNSNANVMNTTLEIFGDGYVYNWSSPTTIDIPSQSIVYSSAFLDIPENYEEKVIMLELNLVDDTGLIDQIKRNLFVPAAPFSDSGLLVTIDTIILSNFPTIDLIFKSQIEETGQYLKNLRKENVFFFEDQERIEDFTLQKDTSGGVNQADIIFVLDVTGSMTNEIEAVKANIVEFTDSLSIQGVDFQLGMVTFLDEIENIYDFTSNVQLFQQYVNQQYAHGGGDLPENSLEALMTATQFDFRPAANRIFIWITDASYHINNSYTPLTPPEVVNEMLTHAIVPHCIGSTEYQQDYYEPILFPTGGDFFDIDGNFRDILLEISRLNSSGSYLLSYLSDAVAGGTYQDIVEVHYAGLGGMDSITFVPPTKALETNDPVAFRCFPNPFYSSACIEIDNPQGLAAKLEIYNVQGQKVFTRYFESGNKILKCTWDAKDGEGKLISNGLYFVRSELFNHEGKPISLPVMKLIYFK